jgi:hypothetical protein
VHAVVEVRTKVENDTGLRLVRFDDHMKRMRSADIRTRAGFDCFHCEVVVEAFAHGFEM